MCVIFIKYEFFQMSHTCCNQFVHIVCLTKDFVPLILEESRDEMYSYVASLVKSNGGQFIARSGTSNHIHLLLNIPTDLSLSDMMRQVKAFSSKWYRQKYNTAFAWNEGYLAFTVSPESIDKVKAYLSTEESRHEKSSVEEEMISFLRFHDIPLNPQYLFKSTYTRLVYHLIWSVKNREPLLEKSFQHDLHNFLKGELENHGCKFHAIGNVSDHIHMLIESPSKVTTADIVMKLKSSSTNIIRDQNPKLSSFCWQEGFGVFSVGKAALKNVIDYVNNQEQHHHEFTYANEIQQLIKAASPGVLT